MKLRIKDGENVYHDGVRYIGAAVWQKPNGERLAPGSKKPDLPNGEKAEWVGVADENGKYRTVGDALDWPDSAPVPAWATRVEAPKAAERPAK